jgi:hypothetical protein
MSRVRLASRSSRAAPASLFQQDVRGLIRRGCTSQRRAVRPAATRTGRSQHGSGRAADRRRDNGRRTGRPRQYDIAGMGRNLAASRRRRLVAMRIHIAARVCGRSAHRALSRAELLHHFARPRRDSRPASRAEDVPILTRQVGLDGNGPNASLEPARRGRGRRRPWRRSHRSTVARRPRGRYRVRLRDGASAWLYYGGAAAWSWSRRLSSGIGATHAQPSIEADTSRRWPGVLGRQVEIRQSGSVRALERADGVGGAMTLRDGRLTATRAAEWGRCWGSMAGCATASFAGTLGGEPLRVASRGIPRTGAQRPARPARHRRLPRHTRSLCVGGRFELHGDRRGDP